MTPLLKNLLILLTLIGLGALGYFIFFTADDAAIISTSSTGGDVNSQAAFQTREFRRTLNELNQIELDSPLFQDSDFLGLIDHAQPIVDRPYGRPNPFSEQ